MKVSMTRRRFVGSAGAGFSAALFAGAVGVNPAWWNASADDGSQEYHGAIPYLDPGAGGHFNAFVTNGILNPPNIYGDLMYVPMGMFYWASKEWLPLLATEWSFIRQGDDGGVSEPSGSATPESIDPQADSLLVSLRDDVVWSDGTRFTSQDVVDTFWCLRIMSNTVWQYIDDIQAVDDNTVSFHMSHPSTIVERYVIRRSPLSSSIYGEWAQKARDLFAAGKTMDDPEGRQLLDQFTQFRPESPIANGPYIVDPGSITNAQLTMVKNEGSVFADKAVFDRILNFNGEGDTISAVVLSKDIDYATQGFSTATEQQMLDSGIRVLRPPTYFGAGLLINYAKLTAWSDKRVRQALAHAIDRGQNGLIANGPSGVPVKYMAGMSDSLVEAWLPEDAIADLNTYEYDPEKAAAMLEEIGWSKSGDIWKTPDGKDAAYELISPAEWVAYSASALDLADQLTNFGIRVENRAITYTQQPVDVDKGNFELAIRPWGASDNPHPHFSFATAFFTHNTLARNNGGSGISFPLVQDTDVAGQVDLEQLVVASAEGLDEDQQRASVTTISQVFNELLPTIPLYERFGNMPALEHVRVASWPPDDDPIHKNSPNADGLPTMLLYTDRLAPASS